MATLTGLIPNTTNYFRINAWANGNQFIKECSFVTSNAAVRSSTPVFGTTKTWKYNSANLDGTDWKSRSYDDSSWAGPSPALLYFETNANVAPRNTALPPNPANPALPYVTYYFRTHFDLSSYPTGASLTFQTTLMMGPCFI